MEHGGERRHVRAEQTEHGVGADTSRRQCAGEGVDLRLERAVGGLGARGRIDEGDACRVIRAEIGEQVVVDADVRDLDIGEGAGEHGGLLR